jgi:hypothetical protein
MLGLIRILFHHGFQTIDFIKGLLPQVIDLGLNRLELLTGLLVGASGRSVLLTR